VTISVTPHNFMWQMKGLLQLYWIKIWHVNSSVKFTHSLQVMYENWVVSLLPVKSNLYSHLNSRTWPDSKRKLPRGFDAAFFKLFSEWLKKLCRVQVYLRKETLQPAQVALAKMPRNEPKKWQETDFLTSEGHLLTSSGCFLTFTPSLDVVQVWFAVIAFCLWAYLISKLSLPLRKRRSLRLQISTCMAGS